MKSPKPNVIRIKRMGRPPAVQARVPLSARISPITALELNRLSLHYKTSVGRVLDSLVETVRKNKLVPPPADPVVAAQRLAEEMTR